MNKGMFGAILVLFASIMGMAAQKVVPGVPVGVAQEFGAGAQEAKPVDKPPITVAEALSILMALRNLDGHIVIIDNNGAKEKVMQPWDFGSGALRLRIANDIAVLLQNEKVADDARQTIVKEILKGMPPGSREIKQGTPERENFERQYVDALNQPARGVSDLGRIKASELKLDKNEIPVSALAAMAPILDMDK